MCGRVGRFRQVPKSSGVLGAGVPEGSGAEGSGGFRRVSVCAGVGTGGRVRNVPESYGVVCCLATLSGAVV